MIVALQGDSGKPRPAVVVQADVFDALPTVVVLPLTSFVLDAAATRINVLPSAANGLRLASQIVVDRPQTVRRTKLGPGIGRLEDAAMLAVERSLAVLVGLG